MIDKPEFPPELVKRCEVHAASVFDADARTRIVLAILRESGRNRLIAALKELLNNTSWANYTDDELHWEAEQGNGLAPVILRARFALHMAGAP